MIFVDAVYFDSSKNGRFSVKKEFSKQNEEDTRAYGNNVCLADMNDAAGLYC